MKDTKKTCTCCGLSKPYTDFYPQKMAKDGRHSQCKECMKRKQHNYYMLKRHNLFAEEESLSAKNEKIRELYGSACWAFGRKHQSLKFLEELLEAALAYVRYMGAKGEDRLALINDFHEEVADVYITTIQQAKDMGDKRFRKLLSVKLGKFEREVKEELNIQDDMK